MQRNLYAVLRNGNAPKQETADNITTAIVLVKNATQTFTIITVDDAAVPVLLKTGDRVTFNVRKNSGQNSVFPGFTVEHTAASDEVVNTVNVIITATHTGNLEPGKYVYDVWLTRANSERYPIIFTSACTLVPSLLRL